MTARENGSEQEPVIRDNRKIDPETGQVRNRPMPDPGDILDSEPDAKRQEQKKEEPAAGSLAEDLAAQLAERTADLQRVQAEYSNYRKRVERDRATVRELAVAAVLTELLPVLDDIGRARDHGELTVHEALMHSYSSEVSETTCVEILQPGYRIGDRILRPARVAVAEPGEPEPASAPAGEASSETSSDEPAGSGDGSGGASADGSAKGTESGDDN